MSTTLLITVTSQGDNSVKSITTTTCGKKVKRKEERRMTNSTCISVLFHGTHTAMIFTSEYC